MKIMKAVVGKEKLKRKVIFSSKSLKDGKKNIKSGIRMTFEVVY